MFHHSYSEGLPTQPLAVQLRAAIVIRAVLRHRGDQGEQVYTPATSTSTAHFTSGYTCAANSVKGPCRGLTLFKTLSTKSRNQSTQSITVAHASGNPTRGTVDQQCIRREEGAGGWVGFGTRPRWLALLACGGAYWPLAFEPSAMTSRHPYYCGHPHCRGHPPS